MGFWDVLFWMAWIVISLVKLGNVQKIKQANRALGNIVSEDQIAGGIMFNAVVLLFARWVIGFFLANWFAQLLAIFLVLLDLGATRGIE
jgi:hypothetical protein